MFDFKPVHDRLMSALAHTPADSPEWIKVNAALVAVEHAEEAAGRRDYVTLSRRLQDAAARLEAITGALEAARSEALGEVRAALDLLQPLMAQADQLLSREAASAVIGMPEVNIASFPAGTATPPPLREKPVVASVVRVKPQPAPQPGALGNSIDAMIDTILQHEGGFVNHPSDRGGPTNYGITLRTLASCRGCSPAALSPHDMEALKLAEAREIYRQVYFVRPRIDRLPELLQPLVFDMSINHGPGTAVKLLQEVLKSTHPPCSIDGGIGDETVKSAVAAVRDLGRALLDKLVDRRIRLYQAIARNDRSQQVFLKGWLRRAESFRPTA